jgi:hypothetical protein
MRIIAVRRSCACLLAVLFAGGPLWADPSKLPPEVGYNHSEIEWPRTAAMGGALRAFSSSVEALQLNPANLAATRVYHVAGLAQFWTDSNRQSYGASIVDSVVSRSRMAGGVSANWVFQDPDGVDREAMDLRLGLALPISDKLLVGASARYLDLKENGYPRGLDVLPPSVASSGLDGGSIVKDITFDAGLSLRPAPGLGISVVGQNITDPGHGFLPLLLGGAVGFGTNVFTIEGDMMGDFTTYEETTWRYMLGGEFLAAGTYPLRVGYRYDEGQESHALSGGIGYAAREFSFDLSARHVFGDESLTAFFIGLKYHVESLGVGSGGNDYE